MKISTRGRYALKIMLDLAGCAEGSPIPLKDIAARQEIPLKYMEQIMSPLTKAGMVKSLRGSSGGYRLARRPEEYSCGEILRVVEGPLKPTLCTENGDRECPMAESCPTFPFWAGLSKVIDEYVDSVKLSDLVKG